MWRQRLYFVAISLRQQMSRRREFYWRSFSTSIFFALTSNSWMTRLSNAKRRIKNTRDFSRRRLLRRNQNLTCLKNQTQRNWFEFDSISKRFQNIFEPLTYHDFKHEKYWRIKISSIYKVKSILELEKFIRAYNLIFETRRLFYVIDQHKIMYAKAHFHQNIFDSKWAWNKHVKKLRVANQIKITWIEFVNFFRKIINSIKQRIIRVEKTLFNLRQRFEQSIIQLIVYLKTLKKQWIDFI